MSTFKRKMNKNKLMFIIAFSLIAVLLVAVLFTFSKINKTEDTKTIGSNVFNYSIGILDETGEYEQGTTSIYLKELKEVDGLNVDIKEDATVTYKVYFYNADEEFISATDVLDVDFDGTSTPEDAEFFRIVVTPTNDAEVSFGEIGRYARQLTVSVNK
ncbi:MAG: hypothetical protein IKC71_05270 [Clostridia bacterium]|nr:hypothetical protein [Clostridia bacterium]